MLQGKSLDKSLMKYIDSLDKDALLNMKKMLDSEMKKFPENKNYYKDELMYITKAISKVNESVENMENEKIVEEVVVEEKVEINEAEANIDKIIKDLGDSNWSGSNEEQGRAVSLFKGLAFSDDPKANEFMKAVDKATTSIANKVLGTTNEDVLLNMATRHLV